MTTIARRVGRYEILREIGRGGMATVYLARQPDLDRDVALKELTLVDGGDPQLARRFLREARLAGSLGHPNIVTVHDYFEDDGTPYIAMEYLPGGALRPRVGHLSLAQIGGVLDGLLSGLAYAEGRRIVHRDLKPENIMVAEQGSVKIADFGIAKATDATQATANLTTTGTTLGTPRYMAPERALGEELGPWSDLYSVGVIVWELLVGRTPFHDTEPAMAVLMRQINDDVPPVRSILPDVDPALSDWVSRLLVKEPADRTRSATDAWDQLEEILTDLLGPRWPRRAGLPAQPGGATLALRPTPRRAALVTAAAATASTAPTARQDDAATEAPLTVPMPPERPRRSRRLPRTASVIAVMAATAAAAVVFGGGNDPPQRAADTAVSSGTNRALSTLSRRARTHRSRLAAAKTNADRGRAARTLARDYADAADAVKPENRDLAAALDDTAGWYRDAATAAQQGSTGDYRDAQARADAAAGAAEAVPTAPPAAQPPPAATVPSGAGDSVSDDPSDDEPDGPEP